MKSRHGFRTSIVFASLASAAWSAISYAQEGQTTSAGASAAPTTTAEGAVNLASREPTLASVIPPPAPAGPPIAPAVPPDASTSRKWYDAVKVEGFVDVYASVNANSPKPQSGQNLGRAFDVTNGFAAHWAGVNVSYAPEPVGGTVALRFGPGATIYNAGSDAGAGLSFVKQAFASWKPIGGVPLELDFGKFDTWIGAEVADSQYNMTYTRSALFSTQPLFHTGLRVDFVATEQLDIKVYAVNGYNNSIDNNAMKTFGATVGLTPVKDIGVYLNYIGGPEQNDLAPATATAGPTVVPGANRRWRHLADVVADLKFARAHLLLNADYGTEKLAAGTLAMADPEKSATWLGGNLTLGYAVTDLFALALRGGYLSDPDGYLAPLWGAPVGEKTSVVDATLTLSVTPTPNLLIKLEPRVDAVSSDASGFEGSFPKAPDASPPGVSKVLFTTTLGVVATTN